MKPENLSALFENGAYTLVVQTYMLCGASCVYAEITSAAAADFLNANGVDCACKTKTEKLLNRQGTGLCPFEQAVLELEAPADCLPVIRATLARLMAGKK